MPYALRTYLLYSEIFRILSMTVSELRNQWQGLFIFTFLSESSHKSFTRNHCAVGGGFDQINFYTIFKRWKVFPTER